jgi:hypothetical protein
MGDTSHLILWLVRGPVIKVALLIIAGGLLVAGNEARQAAARTIAIGTGVFAGFSVISADGCIETDVFIVAAEEGTAATVDVTVFSQNNCIGEVYFAGEGESTNPTLLRISKGLNSARVVALVTVFNAANQENADFDLDITWTGTGPIDVFHDTTVDRSIPGIRIEIDVETARNRQGTASGRFIDESGADLFMNTSSLFAELDDDWTATITVVR